MLRAMRRRPVGGRSGCLLNRCDLGPAAPGQRRGPGCSGPNDLTVNPGVWVRPRAEQSVGRRYHGDEASASSRAAEVLPVDRVSAVRNEAENERRGVRPMTTTTVQSGDAGPITTRTTATKAWVAAGLSALLAFLSSVATALGGAETGFGSITAGQWVTAVIAAIVAFGSAAGLTYAVPNRQR